MMVGQPFFFWRLGGARNMAFGQERRNRVMEETKKQGVKVTILLEKCGL
jgi:hypothetical protein